MLAGAYFACTINAPAALTLHRNFISSEETSVPSEEQPVSSEEMQTERILHFAKHLKDFSYPKTLNTL